jgi:hypothetical protein
MKTCVFSVKKASVLASLQEQLSRPSAREKSGEQSFDHEPWRATLPAEPGNDFGWR